jgi:hypothetical protein
MTAVFRGFSEPLQVNAGIVRSLRPPPKQSSPATRHSGALEGRRYSSYSFLTSALDGGEWSASRHGRALSPTKEPLYPFTGGWVGLGVGLDSETRVKSFAPAGDRTPIAWSPSP